MCCCTVAMGVAETDGRLGVVRTGLYIVVDVDVDVIK